MSYLVFVRHAHRDTANRSADNGIDDKGRSQVLELLDKYKSEILPHSKDFWSSPKLRCVQTVEPLAIASGVSVQIIEELNEQKNSESTKDFQKRIFKFLDKINQLDKTVYLCSHGDWLPEALLALTGDWIDVKKGEAVVCEKDSNGKWKIK